MRQVAIVVTSRDLARWHGACDGKYRRFVLEIWRGELSWHSANGGYSGRRIGVTAGQQHGHRYGQMIVDNQVLTRLTDAAVRAMDAGRDQMTIVIDDRLPDDFALVCDNEVLHETMLANVREAP